MKFKKYYFLLIMSLFIGTSFTFNSNAKKPFLLDNFEDGDLINQLKTNWFSMSDSNSAMKIEIKDSGVDSIGKALFADFEIKDGIQWPWVAFGCEFDKQKQEYNLGRYNAIKFRAKGKGFLMTQIVTTSTEKTYNHYTKGVQLTNDWTTYTLDFEKFRQTWGKPVEWEPATAKGLNFTFVKGGGMSKGTVWLDKIEFVKLKK